jgi:hypothetical protein
LNCHELISGARIRYFLGNGRRFRGAMIGVGGSVEHPLPGGRDVETDCLLVYFTAAEWRGDWRDAYCAHVFFEN